jgi:tetratricopeptide (TPR) repeat protein
MENDKIGGKQPPFFYPKEEDTKLKEEEKAEGNKISNTIMVSFDKISQRYLERYIGAFNRANPKWQVELNEFAKQLGLLLSKRACIPGFYLHVLRKTKSNPKLKRQRATLTKAFLLSMLKPEGFKLEDIIEKPLSVEETDDYTRRHVQRIIHEYVPDAFFEIESAPIKRRDDDRVKSITSIFSSQAMPKTDTSETASQFAKADKDIWGSSPIAIEMIRYNAEINPIMPEYAEDLIAFRQECSEIMCQQNFIVREKYNKYLCDKDGNFTLLFEVFYRQVSSIIAQEWFQNQRPATRKNLIAKGYPFRYKSADAAKARELLLVLLQPEQQVNFLMGLCAISLQEQGLFDQSVTLNKEILKSKTLAPLERGIILENNAMVYRNSKRFKLMIGCMKRALIEYESTGDLYRVSVGWKNIGEAEWYMGFKERAWAYFKKAEENVSNLVNPMERFGVLWNLASAFRRIGEMKAEEKYLTKCLEALPDSETDKIIEIEKRLHQIDKLSRH